MNPEKTEEKLYRDSCMPSQLKKSCANFRSEHFELQDEELTIRPTKWLYLSWGIFLVMGVLPLVFFFLMEGIILPFLLFFLFFDGIAVAGILYTILKRRPVFDFRAGMFYPAGRHPGRKFEEPVPLDQILSLQLLEKLVSAGKGGRYLGYELNVRLRNGKQYNLLNHGSRQGILEDAEILSEKLDLPLERKENPDRARDVRKKNSLALTIVGGCFLFIGGIASYQLCVMPLVNYTRSHGWTETPAVIRESRVDTSRGSKGKTHYHLRIRYTYEWKGNEYSSKRYDYFIDNSDSGSYFRKIVRSHHPMKKVVCYVNPSDPSQAVLNRELSFFAIFPMLFVNVFWIVGLILTIAGARGSKKKNPANQ